MHALDLQAVLCVRRPVGGNVVRRVGIDMRRARVARPWRTGGLRFGCPGRGLVLRFV